MFTRTKITFKIECSPRMNAILGDFTSIEGGGRGPRQVARYSGYVSFKSRKKSSIQSSVFLSDIDLSEISDFCFEDSDRHALNQTNESQNQKTTTTNNFHTVLSKFFGKDQIHAIEKYLHFFIVIGSAFALGFTVWYANNQKRELCPAHQYFFPLQKKCLDNICSCSHGKNTTVREAVGIRRNVKKAPRGCCFQHKAENCLRCEQYFELVQTPGINFMGNDSMWYGNDRWMGTPETGIWPRSELWNESMPFSDYIVVGMDLISELVLKSVSKLVSKLVSKSV